MYMCYTQYFVDHVFCCQIPKNDSSYSLSSSTSGGNFASIPRVEEPLERKEVISITGDVQKFVAAISELKKAMEEADEENEEGVCRYMYMYKYGHIYVYKSIVCILYTLKWYWFWVHAHTECQCYRCVLEKSSRILLCHNSDAESFI